LEQVFGRDCQLFSSIRQQFPFMAAHVRDRRWRKPDRDVIIGCLIGGTRAAFS
jgi:hypothetical protein